jgi:predicted CopG family antitoxin
MKILVGIILLTTSISVQSQDYSFAMVNIKNEKDKTSRTIFILIKDLKQALFRENNESISLDRILNYSASDIIDTLTFKRKRALKILESHSTNYEKIIEYKNSSKFADRINDIKANYQLFKKNVIDEIELSDSGIYLDQGIIVTKILDRDVILLAGSLHLDGICTEFRRHYSHLEINEISIFFKKYNIE